MKSRFKISAASVSLIIAAWSLLTATAGIAQPIDELIYVRSIYAGSYWYDQLSGPAGLAIDNLNNIFIADALNNRIQVCTELGDCYFFDDWNAPSSEAGRFDHPLDVEFLGSDLLAVADTGNNRVQICNLDGNCDVFKDSGGEVLLFDYPSGIAVDVEANLIIAEPRSSRFQRCSLEGLCSIYTIVSAQTGMAVNPEHVSVGAEEELIFIDSESSIWLCVSPEDCSSSNVNATFQDLPRNFQSLTVTSTGRWLIADEENRSIHLCTKDGTCESFDILQERWQRRSPQGTVLDAEGRLLVSAQDRIDVYELISLDGPHIPINIGMNDAWVQPSISGQGFFINVQNKWSPQVFVAWFTFDLPGNDPSAISVLGSADQRWLTAQGFFNTYTANLSVHLSKGGRFLDHDSPVETTNYGSMSLRFRDCDTGTISYDLPSLDIKGSVDLRRIRQDSLTLCEAVVEEWRNSRLP